MKLIETKLIDLIDFKKHKSRDKHVKPKTKLKFLKKANEKR